jgi:hypothetical protein
MKGFEMFKKSMTAIAVSFTLVAMMAMVASAKGPPHPPGEEGDEAANNLSVPAIFVPSTAGSPFTGTCDGTDNSADPTGTKGVDTDGDDIPDEHLDYYVQGVATWQADCDIAATVTASAEWGDNLTNAPLKATTPIRVEIGFLTDPETAMSGYLVEKLDPTLLDRLSHYGTLGNEVADYAEVRVWASGVTLDIRNSDGTVIPANNIAYTAEVNSTGRIVYGFNWQNPVPGTYTITVTAPNITISSADAGTVVDSHTVTLEVTVGNKGGGGGGKGGKGGGGGPGLGGGGGGGGGGGPGGPN